jgi:hypothetical protein
MPPFFKFLSTQLWKIVSEDGSIEIEGQFVSSNIQHDMSANLGKLTGLGRRYPLVSFLNGEVEVIRFQALVWQTHVWSTVESEIEKFKDLLKPNTSTGLTPRCRFFHGTLEIPCLVKSIGGIKYREPNVLGDLKSAEFSMELWRHEDTAFAVTSASGGETETKYVLAKQGEIFETIARREYGDAMLGINLRKLHKEPFLNPGDPVKVLRRTHSKILAPRTPESFLLARDKSNKQIISDFFETRRRSKLSYIV